MRRFLASALEVIEVALVALGAVFLIRTFLVQPFLVSGASMVPNFEDSDYLLIDEVTYHFRAPERGEVIVFRYPKEETTFFIKRIIGLPGEQVEFREGTIIISKGENTEAFVLDEDYLGEKTVTNSRPGGKSVFSLNEGEYFVLGDNRLASYDSRDWGILTTKDVTGLVRLRLWPVTDFTVFAAPSYQY